MNGKLLAIVVMTAIAGLSFGTPARSQTAGQPAPTSEATDEVCDAETFCELALKGDDALPADTVADLKEKPNIILQTYPAGGALMIGFVAKAVASDFSLLQSFLGVLAEANPLQQSAMGFGLAQAAQLYESLKCCGPNAGAIAEAVAETGNQRLIDAFDEGTGGVPGVVDGGPAGPGTPGGPVGATTATIASNAPDVAGGGPTAGLRGGAGVTSGTLGGGDPAPAATASP